MADFCLTRMTERQRILNNRMCRDEAISRKKRYFTGVCRKHGETKFRLELAHGKIAHRCIACSMEKKNEHHARNHPNPEELARLRRNRVKSLEALAKGETAVELECKVHGLTMFTIYSTSKIHYCRKCHNARVNKNKREKRARARMAKAAAID